jgi:hypothetical protein
MKYLVALFWIAFSFQAFADDGDTGDRRVEGKTIIFKSEASADSEPTALFRAESLATRALIIECGFASKEIRIHSRKVTKVSEPDPDYNHAHPEWNRGASTIVTYTAKVEASIGVPACEHARVISSNPAERKKYENDQMVRDQHRFERLTDSDLGLVEEQK